MCVHHLVNYFIKPNRSVSTNSKRWRTLMLAEKFFLFWKRSSAAPPRQPQRIPMVARR